MTRPALMIRSYLATAEANALGARAHIALVAMAETNWRRFNMLAFSEPSETPADIFPCFAVQAFVFRAVDLPHSTRAYFFQNSIMAERPADHTKCVLPRTA